MPPESLQEWIHVIEMQDISTLEGWAKEAPDHPLFQDEVIMMAAIHEGCQEILEILLAHGAPLDGALQEAILHSDLSLLKLLKSHGADPNARNRTGIAPLHVLANRDRFLESMGSNLYSLLGEVEEHKEDEDTQGRLKILYWLLGQDIDINQRVGVPGMPARNFPPGATPLDIAELTKSTVIAEAIRNKGGENSPQMVRMLLFRFVCDAGSEGGQERFRTLFNKTPNAIQIQNDEGESLLHLAVRFGHNEEIKWLLNQGGNINARTSNNSSAPPLVYALFGLSEGRATLSTLEMVLEAGASTHVFSSPGLTPVAFLTLLARQIRQPEEALEMLLERGADAVTPLMVQGDATPIELAATQGALPWRYFQLLLDKGADATVVTPENANLLHKLMLQYVSEEQKQDRLETLHGLVSHGLDLGLKTTRPIINEAQNIVIPEGATPFDIALIREHQELWLPLLELDAPTALFTRQDVEMMLNGEFEEEEFELDRYLQESRDTLQAIREEVPPGNPKLEYIEHLLGEQDFDGALDAIDELLSVEPDLVEGYLLKAQILAYCELYNESLAFASRYADVRPEEGYPHLLIGSLLFELQRFENAIESFQQGLELSSDKMDADLYAVMGASYMNLGRFEEALEALTTAIHMDPEGLDPEVKGWHSLTLRALAK